MANIYQTARSNIPEDSHLHILVILSYQGSSICGSKVFWSAFRSGTSDLLIKGNPRDKREEKKGSSKEKKIACVCNYPGLLHPSSKQIAS
jgi:hypothetical protein